MTPPALDELFAAPAAEIPRDSYGRPRVPHPQTGVVTAFQRVSTFARTIADTYGLDKWKQRMLLRGAAARPDLLAEAARLDVRADARRLDALVEQLLDAAGANRSAELGTVLHKYAENVDVAADPAAALAAVPLVHRAPVAAYAAALSTVGITAVPDAVERFTALPQLGVAGSPDNVVRLPDGSYAIGDKKSGQNLTRSWAEIEVQLACYAHGVNASGFYDPATRTWAPWTLAPVRTDIGIVMHMPSGGTTCTLYVIDLVAGWEDARLCVRVRDRRKARRTGVVFDPALLGAPTAAPPVPAQRTAPEPAPAPGPDPSWAERFAAVTSRADASALYAGAAAELGAGSDALAELVAVGMAALAGQPPVN